MLHFIAFDQTDSTSKQQLMAAISVGDVLVFCERAIDWPADDPIRAKHPNISLSEGESSEQLAQWLTIHNAMYWSAI